MNATTAVKICQRWSWHDYLTWPEGERWELIDGVAFAMAPAPTIAHQSVAGHLFSRLDQALKGKPCRPFVAPVDVKLSDHDVVQPDVLVVCNPAKITASHIAGAPDLVIEVLSPSTAARDLREKKAIYAHHGVTEYLVVDPLENYVIRFLLSAGYGAGDVFAADETVSLESLNGLSLDLREVFDLPPPASEAERPVVSAH